MEKVTIFKSSFLFFSSSYMVYFRHHSLSRTPGRVQKRNRMMTGEIVRLTDSRIPSGQPSAAGKCGIATLNGYALRSQTLEHNQFRRQKPSLRERITRRRPAQKNHYNMVDRTIRATRRTAEWSPARAFSTTCRVSGDLSAIARSRHAQSLTVAEEAS